MKKILIILILAIQFYTPCIAQDSLKTILVKHLIEKEELLLGGEIKDYYNSIIYVELLKRDDNLNQKYGVYIFGTIDPHTSKYILIKNDSNYEILDLNFLNETLDSVIVFLKDVKTQPETILDYVEMIIKEYNNLGGYEYVKD